MRTRFLASAGVSVALVATSLVAGTTAPAGARTADGRAVGPVAAAAAWLATQQQADGGFEVAGFPGFETSDAVLALAAAGQTGASWDEEEALAAVEGVTSEGEDALDAIDDLVDSPASPAQAAKVITLVAVPLGLDVDDFDPSDDTEEAVDLVALVTAGAGPEGDYAAVPFGGRLSVAWALAALDLAVPAALLSAIDAAQQANGSFHYSGLSDGTGYDPDITAAAVIALVQAGRPVGDPTVTRAVVSLGRSQQRSGEWATEFDTGNPSSTALVMLAAATLGADPDGTCWRDRAEPRFAGVRHHSPSAALLSRQAGDGHVASPNDGWGLNTLATSQAIQGLAAAEGHWPYAGPACTVTPTPGHRRLVNAHYYDLLGRFSDEAGAQYWVGLLDGGVSPAVVARHLVFAPEYGQRVVDGLTRRYLGRPATAGERSASGPAVVAGRRLHVIAGMLGGPDYFAGTVEAPASPTTSSWIDAVYRDLLGREPDAAGRDWLQGRLDGGASRTAMARQVLHTLEAAGVLVDGFYGDLLRRQADPAGRGYWAGRLQGGADPEVLVAQIIGSAEYVAATSA